MGDETQANQVSGSFWEKMMNILSRNPFPEPLGKRTQPRVLLFFQEEDLWDPTLQSRCPGGLESGRETPERWLGQVVCPEERRGRGGGGGPYGFKELCKCAQTCSSRQGRVMRPSTCDKEAASAQGCSHLGIKATPWGQGFLAPGNKSMEAELAGASGKMQGAVTLNLVTLNVLPIQGFPQVPGRAAPPPLRSGCCPSRSSSRVGGQTSV